MHYTDVIIQLMYYNVFTIFFYFKKLPEENKQIFQYYEQGSLEMWS